MALYRVLNAFRHHRNSHRKGEGNRQFHVLNAFRHHRNSHTASRVSASAHLRCSTPFGIIGILTATPRLCLASLCSTPFGIIGIHTRLMATLTRVRVLNAFRHHRNSHTVSDNAEDLPISAQRLSASLEFSQDGSLTRLSITKLCSTPFGIIGILTSMLHEKPLDDHVVLNAFRHHRNSHAYERVKQNRPGNSCSTPFGIIGILTALVPTLLFAGCCNAVFGHLFVLASFFFSQLLSGPFRLGQSSENQTLNQVASISTANLPHLTPCLGLVLVFL